MGKGDDFAGVGVAVKRGRGRPPMKNQQWVQWASAIHGRVQRYGTVNVYLADGELAVRADVRGSQLVPAGAVFVGRYEKPFTAKAFYWDMERLVLGAAGHPQPDVPRNEDFAGRDVMIRKIRSYLCMMRRPVDVYIDRATMAVALRAAPLGRAAKCVPTRAEFLGRYDVPFSARDFCDDLAAHLATVPQQVAA